MNKTQASGDTRGWTLGGVSAMVLAFPAAAYAQAAAEHAPTALEEVVVTAQKRSEPIRDVPISITALTSNDVKNAGISTNLELTNLVPGLKMDKIAAFTDPSIRGISTYVTNPGVDPNVATYVDGVYQASSAALTFDLPDVDHLEVLKGPQGTLFGRNATGGAIQVFTKDPSFTPTGEVSASYGRFKDQTVKGFVSGPLMGDKVAGSLAVFEETADSYNHNLTPQVPLEKIKSYVVRGKLLFAPSEDFKLRLLGYYGRRNDPSSVNKTPWDGITVAQALGPAGFPGAVIPTQPLDVAGNFTAKQNILVAGGSAHATLNSAVGEFNGIVAYNHSRVTTALPAMDAAAPPPFTGVWYFYSAPDTSETAELNFASKKWSRFSFIAGVNYYHDKAAWDPLVVSQSLPFVAGSPYLTGSYQVTIFGRQTSTAYAAYGELTYDLTDRLTVIGGLRYSHEKRGISGEAVFGSFAHIPGPWYDYGRRSDSDVTERVSLRYRITPETNAYFTYSTGFKSGSYNNSSIPFLPPGPCAAAGALNCPFPPYVNPEKVKAYELGVKSAPTPWLHLDAAVFDYDYTNQQINSYQSVGGIPLSVLENAASAKIRGAEINVDAQVTSEFRVRGGVSILHARFDKFPAAQVNLPAPGNVGTVPVSRDAKHNKLPRAPDATLTLSGTYTKELPAGTMALTANFYASSKVFYDAGDVYSQSAYSTLGLRGSFQPASLPGLTLAAWGANVTDKKIIMGTFVTQNSAGFAYAPPATYGVTVSYAF